MEPPPPMQVEIVPASSFSSSTATPDPTNPALAAAAAAPAPTTSGITPPSSGFSSPSAFNDDNEDLADTGDAYDAWAHEDESALPPSLPLALPPSSPPPPNPGSGKHTEATLVNPWSRLNWGITLGSFVYALTSTFLSIPCSYYIVQDLQMDGTALNVVSTMMLLPQALQLPFGLLSDCVPIYHQRRKPYLIIGWCMNFAAMAALAAVGTPSITSLLPLVFLSTCGGQLIDIAGKALVVQRSRHEEEAGTGFLLVTVSLADAVGDMLGTLLGTFVYKDSFSSSHRGKSPFPSLSLGQIGLFNLCVAVLVMGPSLFFLYDGKVSPTHSQTRPLKEELRDVWRMVTRQSLLWPMLFVAIYQCFWLPNNAWDVFLIKGLGFSEWRMGVLGLVGTITGALGAWYYRSCLLHANWRKVFGWSLVLMTFLDLLLLLLVFRVNIKWGIPDLAFILGQNVVDAFLDGFHELPLSILYLGFCPKGAEGTTLATLQTFTSLAVMMSNNLSLLSLRFWPVDEPTVTSGNFSGIWKLTLLTALAQSIGLIGLPLLPRNVAHQRETQRKGNDKRSIWGGRAFVGFVCVAFCCTIILDVLTVVREF